MLAFTPEVKEALRWFQVTHQPQVGFGAVQWVRVGWPHPGAASEQDARLVAALEVLQGVMNAIEGERRKKGDAGAELAAFRKANGRNQ